MVFFAQGSAPSTLLVFYASYHVPFFRMSMQPSLDFFIDTMAGGYPTNCLHSIIFPSFENYQNHWLL